MEKVKWQMDEVRIEMEKTEPGLYKHYKGQLYEVIGLARHSETLEELVVYKATYQEEGKNLWVRPRVMFEEIIIVEGKQTQRFTKV